MGGLGIWPMMVARRITVEPDILTTAPPLAMVGGKYHISAYYTAPTGAAGSLRKHWKRDPETALLCRRAHEAASNQLGSRTCQRDRAKSDRCRPERDSDKEGIKNRTELDSVDPFWLEVSTAGTGATRHLPDEAFARESEADRGWLDQ